MQATARAVLMRDQRAAGACLLSWSSRWLVATACQVATLVRADWLFLLTDVPCLYTANPSTDPSAQPIHEVHDIAALQARSPDPLTSAVPSDCMPSAAAVVRVQCDCATSIVCKRFQ